MKLLQEELELANAENKALKAKIIKSVEVLESIEHKKGCTIDQHTISGFICDCGTERVVDEWVWDALTTLKEGEK